MDPFSQLEHLVFELELYSSHWSNEARAQKVLSEIAKEGSAAIPVLCRLVSRKNHIIQIGAARAIRHLRPPLESVKSALVRALRSNNDGVAEGAACALACHAPSSFPFLFDALRSKTEIPRSAAAHAITEAVTEWADSIVSGLAALSFDSDWRQHLGPKRPKRRMSIPKVAVANPLTAAFHRAAWRCNIFKDHRDEALWAIEEIGLQAAILVGKAMAKLGDAKKSRALAVRSSLAQERILAEIEGLLGIPRQRFRLPSLASRNRRDKKRPIAELEKSVLALLNTCLAWGMESVSERKIYASSILKANRRKLKLDGGVSQSSVHNHLSLLAQVCGLNSLLEAHSKRQASRFRSGVKEQLLSVKDELVACVKEQEELAARQAQYRDGK